MKAEIIQVLARFVGSFGFAVLYNLRGKKLCMAGISGMVSWIAYLIVWNEMPSTFVANLAAAAVATIYAEIVVCDHHEEEIKEESVRILTVSLI